MIRHISALAAVVALSLSSVACMAPIEEEDVEVEETTQDFVSRSARFETFMGLDGRYYFHLIAGNGENVLRSQGYTALASAENGVASVRANGNDKRNFDVREANNGQFYFNLKAGNGEVIGTSELYVSKSNAERGARTVRALVRLVNEASPSAAPRRERFEIFTGEDKKTYFRLRAANGEILLGSQGYTAKASAKEGHRVRPGERLRRLALRHLRGVRRRLGGEPRRDQRRSDRSERDVLDEVERKAGREPHGRDPLRPGSYLGVGRIRSPRSAPSPRWRSRGLLASPLPRPPLRFPLSKRSRACSLRPN